MIQLLKILLQQILDDIDTGNSNISEEEEEKIIKLCQEINHRELSKVESANYIGVSRATFDNYIAKGLIPKGHKRQGYNALGWNKFDLDKFKKLRNKKK